MKKSTFIHQGAEDRGRTDLRGGKKQPKIKSFLSIQPSLHFLVMVRSLNMLLWIMLASVWGFPIHVADNICSVGANNLSERCIKKQENVFTEPHASQGTQKDKAAH
ncbi:unnamed protein product [Rangifer tarandus platyrhynchus]|uniref:Uncharacterized protein n=1 Tax=Rangifer tarandus platyrhynchus TaxID=3082113 RepID=A0ABN9A844_RANTA|nr:unnamed protein product [Rangifer tarandus platyrhynchus]